MIDPNELLGQDLGGYRVTTFLGAGASAWVYRAESTFDSSIVRALKVVHPSLMQEAEFRQRFAEEAHTLDRLRHPGIVRFYGVRPIQYRGDELLVMELEFLDGHTLRQYATRADPTAIPLHRAVRWVREAAEAIGVAHQMGVVHRDLDRLTAQGLAQPLSRVARREVHPPHGHRSPRPCTRGGRHRRRWRPHGHHGRRGRLLRQRRLPER